MRFLHISLVALLVLFAGLMAQIIWGDAVVWGSLGNDEIIWGTLGDGEYVVWGT
jgi:hypothetical protein